MANNSLQKIGYTGQRRFQYDLGTFSQSFNTADKLPEGAPVKFSADNVVSICTADDMPIGLCVVRPNTFYAQRLPAPVRTTIAIGLNKGVLLVKATGTVAAGDEIMIDGTDVTSTTQGEWLIKGKAATEGKVVIGTASEAATSGQDFSMFLNSAYIKA